MSVFLSPFYFVSTNAAMIVGNLRYDFGGGMSGFATLVSGNLGNSEAGCAFNLSANGAQL